MLFISMSSQSPLETRHDVTQGKRNAALSRSKSPSTVRRTTQAQKRFGWAVSIAVTVLILATSEFSSDAQEPPFQIDREATRRFNANASYPLTPIAEPYLEASPTLPVADDGVPFQYDKALIRIPISLPPHRDWTDYSVGYHVPALDLLIAFRLRPFDHFSQDKVVPSLPGEIEREVEALRKEVNQLVGNNREPKAEDIEEFKRLVQTTGDLLVEGLGEEQVKALQQTAWQHRIYEVTLPQLLLNGSLGKELGITEEQRQLLRDFLPEEMERVKDAFVELEYRQFLGYEQVLAKDDWSVLKRRYDDIDAWKALPLPLYQYVYTNAVYCRQFRNRLLADPPRNMRFVIDGHIQAELIFPIMIMESADVHEYLELDARHIQAMKQATTAAELACLQLQLDIRAAEEAGESDEATREMGSELDRMRRALPFSALQGLTEETRLKAEYMSQLYCFRGGSFPRELVEGDLWKEFELTSDERRALLTRAIEDLELTRQTHQKIMREHVERIIELLEPVQQRTLRASIGVWNDHLMPGEPQYYLEIMAKCMIVDANANASATN